MLPFFFRLVPFDDSPCLPSSLWGVFLVVFGYVLLKSYVQFGFARCIERQSEALYILSQKKGTESVKPRLPPLLFSEDYGILTYSAGKKPRPPD